MIVFLNFGAARVASQRSFSRINEFVFFHSGCLVGLCNLSSCCLAVRLPMRTNYNIRMLVVCNLSITFLDSVDFVGMDKPYVDVCNTTTKFFKTIQIGLKTDLSFNDQGFDDMEWVMKFAGGRGKSAVERFADAVAGCDVIQDCKYTLAPDLYSGFRLFVCHGGPS